MNKIIINLFQKEELIDIRVVMVVIDLLKEDHKDKRKINI
jgi:hypothetical protein